MKGALEKVLQQCTHYVSSAGELQPLQETHCRDYMQHSVQLGTMGLRGECGA